MAALFGSELRRIRAEANLSQDALGEVLGYTGSLVGQIETAKRSPTQEFAERLDGALGTGGLFGRLWPHVGRGPYPDYFRTYAELERRASEILEFGGFLIPGLGQTEQYMRAIFRSGLPFAPEAGVESSIRTRLLRQELLSGPTRPVLWWLIDEAAIRRPIGGSAVMAGQLRHLTELIRSRVVVVQVLEQRSGAHAALEGALTLMSFADGSPDVAYIEGPHVGVLVESTETVRKIRLTYDLARADALSPKASLALIDRATEEHASEEDRRA
ncbi:helix-turn-helix domain-containing protein [Kitasatospora phosalacinea]|uniref:Transcriptional regulator n=1 Tax=Kitasatospora phosalacinea TaxID=2065 RepID=A0A9W6PF10_9ACTN|nr:helix-turn-helix transcriptional regulator [Kitasatospora phosalacinea]GLW53722.1 transcriptional regulator [Kitasatospora phosalacinea]